jgi:uncharacterized membrane protein
MGTTIKTTVGIISKKTVSRNTFLVQFPGKSSPRECRALFILPASMIFFIYEVYFVLHTMAEGVFMLKILAAIDRHSRWILLVIMLLFIITGFGITKNIMDQRLAKQLHENVLPVPFYVLLLLHVFYPLPANLVRWKAFKSETVAAVYAYILAAIFLGLCLWLHFR